MFHEHAYSVRLLDGIGIPLVPISELIQLILHRLWKRAADLASKILIVMMRNESGLHFLVFIHCMDEIIDSHTIRPIPKDLALFRSIRSDDVDRAVLLPAIIGLFFDIAVSRHAARCENNGEIFPHLFDPGLIRAALSIEDDDHLQIVVRPVVFQKIDQLLAA